MKLLFTADVHGNVSQYERFYSLAERMGVDAVLLGGDLAPKSVGLRTINSQREFLHKTLLPIITSFYQKTRILTYLILGNDDFRTNEDVVASDGEGFVYVHNKVVKLGKFHLAGYSYVPITPFRFKDWEKPDAQDVLEDSYRSGFVIDGMTSESGSLQSVHIDLGKRDDSIQADLERFHCDALILMAHSPPFNSKLDVIRSGDHVGSLALRRFIETEKPLLTLHGHIHETVEMSGSFKEVIGKTLCLAVGNDPYAETLSALLIDMTALSAKRLVE